MKETSWGNVANWYDSHLKESDSYHAKVILPNLLRLLGEIKEKKILDLATGQGFFAHNFAQSSKNVYGVDIAKELIEIAQKRDKGKVKYFSSPSHNLSMFKNGEFDLVVCVLALQNIENISGTFKEVKRVLKPKGKLIFVLNHPAFRVPKESSWGYDEKNKIQYRRVDAYLSESKIKIDMNPGNPKNKQFTVSFHRPLQFWFKALAKEGFAVTKIEEWISHKKSGKGPREKAENKARIEIPLFLAVESTQL